MPRINSKNEKNLTKNYFFELWENISYLPSRSSWKVNYWVWCIIFDSLSIDFEKDNPQHLLSWIQAYLNLDPSSSPLWSVLSRVNDFSVWENKWKISDTAKNGHSGLTRPQNGFCYAPLLICRRSIDSSGLVFIDNMR